MTSSDSGELAELADRHLEPCTPLRPEGNTFHLCSIRRVVCVGDGGDVGQ